MELTGFAYLVFFLLVLAAHHYLRAHGGWQKAMLTAASYYFYATIDWRFMGLLAAFSVINYSAGEVVMRARSPALRRAAVAAAVVASLAMLGYFKYLNFFAAMLNSVAQWMGQDALLPLVSVLLPVGISFMTFQAISYPIDLYAGRLQKTCSFGDFALFIAFFPRLLAGPIVPAAYFLPQLEQPVRVSEDQRFEGLALVLRGVVKKVLLADTLGSHLVDPAFANPGVYSSAFLWLAMFGYSLQAYLDLSGYTDMALGAARMLGYRLPSNFNRPYLATSVANFWQRWHISMSSFFRNYLYTPLSAAWSAPAWLNLLIVFVAIGLWHGAGWNFVVYGLLHGSLVALEHLRSEARTARGLPAPVYRGLRLALQVALIFSIVSLTRILFRSESLAVAGSYLAAMAGPLDGRFPLSLSALLALAAAALLHFTPMRWREQLMAAVNRQPAWAFGANFAAITYLSIVFTRGNGGFIYFQF
ncbi:MBOAT family protein [Massilia sp. BJB1822]|uniref:MBOAT family O-acyltransferase n=1 Tax=Massilia sp. BJB1822 TaxID=2744470 RepID=UPI001593D0F9|nr:MBOAT family protein [Massilia sp. BJB1822]